MSSEEVLFQIAQLYTLQWLENVTFIACSCFYCMYVFMVVILTFISVKGAMLNKLIIIIIAPSSFFCTAEKEK